MNMRNIRQNFVMDINNVMSIKTTLEMAKTNHLEAQIQMCQFCTI